MTFAELQSLVSYWLDDLNFGYFTQTQVKVWLNEGQKEVQKKLIKAGQNYYTDFVQTTTVQNQSYYVLPSDFKKLNRLEIVTAGTVPNESVQSLVPMTINQQDLIARGPGQPLFYFIQKDQLVLFPTPDIAQTLRLYYSYQVADMTLDNDSPDVPEAYHQLIALYACQDGFIKDGRANELLVKKISEFERDMDMDSTDRQQDTVREVVMTGDDIVSYNGFSW